MPRRTLLLATVTATGGIALAAYFILATRPKAAETPRPHLDVSSPKREPTPAPEPALPRREARVYFLDEPSGKLVSEMTSIEGSRTIAGRARQVLSRLFEGPSDVSHRALLPSETRLLGLFVDEHGEAYVNLSHDVSTATGVEEEFLGLCSLALSLAASNPEIHRMRLLVEGRETATFRGHISTEYPLRVRAPTYAALLSPAEPAPWDAGEASSVSEESP